MTDRGEIDVTVDGELPTAIEVGHGTCLVVRGSCRAAGGAPRSVRLLLSGRSQDLGGFSREAGGGRWWSVLELPSTIHPQLVDIEAEVAMRRGDGVRIPLGTIELKSPWEAPPLDYRAAAERGDGSITGALTLQPKVAVCMTLSSSDIDAFRHHIDSMARQTYTNWTSLIGVRGSRTTLVRVRQELEYGGRVALYELGAARDEHAALEHVLKSAPPEAPYLVVPSTTGVWGPHALQSMLAGLTPEANAVMSSVTSGGTAGPRHESGTRESVPRLLLDDAGHDVSVLFRREILEYVFPWPPVDSEAASPSQWIALIAGSLGNAMNLDAPGRARPGAAQSGQGSGSPVSMAIKARMLEARCGDYLERGDRRWLRRIATVPTSRPSRLWLALRARR